MADPATAIVVEPRAPARASSPTDLEVPAAGTAPAGKPPVDGHDPAHPQHDGLAQIVARQWPVLVTTAALAVLLGVAYLMVAAKTYTASARLRVSPSNPAELTGGTSAEQQPEDYLETECDVIKSEAVLGLAVADLQKMNPSPLRGLDHPLETLKAGVEATVAKKGKIIEVAYPSHRAADAERIVGAVVTAYQAYNADFFKQRQKDLLDTLERGGASQSDTLKELYDRLHLISVTHPNVLDGNPDNSPTHLTVVNLRDAKNKAELEAIAARTAYAEAIKGIASDPAMMARFDQRVATGIGYSADPQAHLRKAQEDLGVWQLRLADAKTQFMASHPTVQQYQLRVGQLQLETVVAARQWKEAAEQNQAALEHGLADAQRIDLEAEQQRVEYRTIQDRIKQLTDSTNNIQNQIGRTQLAAGAGAVAVSVLDRPRADMQHASPSPTKVLGVALAVGLLGGAGLGSLRDWADDRFRTLHAVRAAAGAPVLGSIPSIPQSVAASAPDRGQVVHFDPFGDASESYRTLRTALQFGMPSGTRTLLVTSPNAGDGKSTLVSNLGIALAQANRRVIIVDADLRAPVQHRLHRLHDRTGLATVLADADGLDDAIQPTHIEGLDVLPAGPIPTNPSELINAPAFSDHLNELADRYDFVLVDSPPVTAVTDARILAALCDASLLVVRLGSSTRTQTERARDALRGVGARLVGVAVNGVSRRGNLASATGYYGRVEGTPPAPTVAGTNATLPAPVNGSAHDPASMR